MNDKDLVIKLIKVSDKDPELVHFFEVSEPQNSFDAYVQSMPTALWFKYASIIYILRKEKELLDLRVSARTTLQSILRDENVPLDLRWNLLLRDSSILDYEFVSYEPYSSNDLVASLSKIDFAYCGDEVGWSYILDMLIEEFDYKDESEADTFEKKMKELILQRGTFGVTTNA
jgi:hypothetical protein